MELVASLTPIEKLIKARVKLNKHNPFFAYLVMKLNFKEAKEVGTVGVDKYGNCAYNPEWVATLTDESILYVLAHEVLHCAFEHWIRLKSRDLETWNIATDSVINAILNRDNFKGFVEGGVNPNNLKDKKGQTIFDVHNKTAEEIYDLIVDNKSNKKGNQGFDVHIYSDDYKDGDMDKAKAKSMGDGRYWKKQLAEAYAYGKLRGNVPAGIERQLEKLLDNTIDWKSKLYKHITNLIPVDYTWRFPHKKSYSLHTYLPAVSKERLDIIVDLDTSGSISQKQLTEFLSETVGILQQFNNVELTMLSSDMKVYNPKTIFNPTVRDIANYKVKGGGGTSHKPVFEWVRKNKPNAQLLICFTDGYTDFPNPNEVRINTIWVLSNGHKNNIPFGDIIELKRD